MPKNVDSLLTNFIVYELETHNTDRARPYFISFYRLSKLAGKYDHDLTLDEIDKCKKDTIVFDGDHCVEKAKSFRFLFEIKRRRTKNS